MINYKNYIVLRKGFYSENRIDECLVSKASKEIMLNRISEGYDLEFPFTYSLKKSLLK